MKSAWCVIALTTALVTPSTFALTFNFETIGFTIPSDCTDPPVPLPACAVLDVFGTTNDIGDFIPGTWDYTAHGQVLFGMGSGTFLFDDPSAADNDFFGTWSNVLTPPDAATGIAQSFFEYDITGGRGIFIGASGSGTSSLDVVVAPFDVVDGIPLFAAACPGAPARIGSFCERGTFSIPEPHPLALTASALLIALSAQKRRFGVGRLALGGHRQPRRFNLIALRRIHR
jgi:hypothetical protein